MPFVSQMSITGEVSFRDANPGGVRRKNYNVSPLSTIRGSKGRRVLDRPDELGEVNLIQ